MSHGRAARVRRRPSDGAAIHLSATWLDRQDRAPAPGLSQPRASAPLPAGSGARALGQANAFTAVADDATAASWNPAAVHLLLSYSSAPFATNHHGKDARAFAHNFDSRLLLWNQYALLLSQQNEE